MSARPLAISVLIPTRNEARNLASCLEALRGWAGEIVVADSGSSDGTVEIARQHGATVVQFVYDGGWPKKRQWVLDTFHFRHEWVLLLDADEYLDTAVWNEIASAIARENIDGYWLRFQLHFLNRPLRHGGFDLWKLSLFRRGRGHFERRIESDQTREMADIEIHEHVVVDGRVGRLSVPIRHQNDNSLFRYIAKHNEYSEWEARLYFEGQSGEQELKPALFGSQAQRRRWLKRALVRVPGFPFLTFVYHYVVRLGFLDGRPGLIYCGLKGIQRFHSKAKWYELSTSKPVRLPAGAPDMNSTDGSQSPLKTAERITIL